jgi:hypothetical protein
LLEPPELVSDAAVHLPGVAAHRRLNGQLMARAAATETHCALPFATREDKLNNAYGI